METWRKATDEEVRDYYRAEFRRYLNELPPHVSPDGPFEYGIKFRDPHPVVGDQGLPFRDFIRRDTRKRIYPVGTGSSDPEWGPARFVENGKPSWNPLIDFITYPATNDPLSGSGALRSPEEDDTLDEPVPAAVYYGIRNHDDRYWWPIVFDIDAKDVAARNVLESSTQFSDLDPRRDRDTLLENGDVYEQSPKGFPYSFDDVEQAIGCAFDLKRFLEEDVGFEEVLVIYTGQGTHVYVLDSVIRERLYTKQTREFLANTVSEDSELGIPIDRVVTHDEKRIPRLPYSLHSDVSRIVTPIESPNFDFRADAVPTFVSSS